MSRLGRGLGLLSVFALCACAEPGTGVLLTVEGMVALDALSVEASLPDRMVSRESAVDSGLPLTYLAQLPDADTTVSFVVRAKLGGRVVAEGATGAIAVRAHAVATATVVLGGGPPPDFGVDGGGFVVQRGGDPPVGPALSSVFGFGADEVYATSRSAGGANLLHSVDRGASWQAMGVGPGAPALHAGWGASASSLVLVGEGGAVLRGAGGAFNAETTPAGTRTLRGVWGASPSDVYVVGDGNLILHSVTGGWVVQTPVGTRALYGVWGSDAQHVWAVGDGGAILFSTGNGIWTLQSSGTSATLRAVGGRAGEVYVVGDGGTILRSTGDGTWTAQTSPMPGIALHGLYARANGEAFAVGERWSVLGTAGGGSWGVLATGLAVSDPTGTTLSGAWVSAAGDLFVVGAGQTILRRGL